MRRGISVAVVVVTLVAASCGDESSDGCTEIREPLDPLSIQHLIDVDGATFLTHPPTSGPHLSGPLAVGLLDAPLPPAAQVSVLEAGVVMVQYESPVTELELLSLLDHDDVPFTIAPGTDLPAPVVATAWTWKLTCGSVDLDAITTFAEAHVDDAPGSE
jgi:hypothetical protein